jgi:hypothetical protein
MADASGSITAQFSPTVNNATLAGLEVVAGSSTVVPPTPAPAPTPAPTAPPTAGNNPYYPYSAKFTGKTPFHDTIARMQNAGVLAQDSNQATEANKFWSGGVAGNQQPYGQTAEWVGNASGQTLKTWTSETMYGPPNANIISKQSYFPSGATGQNADYDNHTVDSDPSSPSGAGEYAGFQCGTTSSTITNCGWGAQYLFTGSGLSYDLPNYAGSLNAGGCAPGLLTLSAYDMYNAAHGIAIAHGLGMVTGCGQAPAGGRQYPSSASSVETTCSNLPNTTYGSIVQLNPNFNISGSGASQYPLCQYEVGPVSGT